jgi:hypothetical protein
MLCYVMLCYVMLCYVRLCCVVLCCIMLCYVVMLCYVMLCYIMLNVKRHRVKLEIFFSLDNRCCTGKLVSMILRRHLTGNILDNFIKEFYVREREVESRVE